MGNYREQSAAQLMKFLDLRTTENLKKILPGYKDRLIELKEKMVVKGSTGDMLKDIQNEVVINMLNSAIENIEKDKVNNTNIRNLVKGFSQIFCEYVKALNYQGIIAWEKGDRENSFDHEQVRVVKEHRVI